MIKGKLVYLNSVPKQKEKASPVVNVVRGFVNQMGEGDSVGIPYSKRERINYHQKGILSTQWKITYCGVLVYIPKPNFSEAAATPKKKFPLPELI